MAEAREFSVPAQITKGVTCGQNEYWEVQRHGHEADHSSPPSVEIKNVCGDIPPFTHSPLIP